MVKRLYSWQRQGVCAWQEHLLHHVKRVVAATKHRQQSS